MDFLSGLAGAACGIAQGLYFVCRTKQTEVSTSLVSGRSPCPSCRIFELSAPPRLQAQPADSPSAAYGVPTDPHASAVVLEFKVERLPERPRIG